MLDLAVLLVLGFGFIIGLKRGFILQVVHLTGFIIAFIIAHLYYNQLAPKLTLWIPYPNFSHNPALSYILDNANLEDAYYRAIAFVVIFFAAKLVLGMIARLLNFMAQIPVLKQLNTWVGGILGFVEVYFIMFILLFIAALLPVESIETTLTNSFLAELIVQHTPLLSQQIQDLWITKTATM